MPLEVEGRVIGVLSVRHPRPATYSDADLQKFEEIGGKPIWDKWVADNKSKFDAKGVLDALLNEIRTAKAKVAANK